MAEQNAISTAGASRNESHSLVGRQFVLKQCREIARAATDLESMFRGIARAIYGAVQFSQITLAMLDPRIETGDLVLEIRPPDWHLWKQSRGPEYRRNISAAHEILAVGAPRMLVREILGWSSDYAVAPDIVGERFHSAIGVPLMTGGNRVGAMILRFEEADDSSSEVVGLLNDVSKSIAGHVNKAAANSRARNDIQDLTALNGMSRAMAVTDSAHDAAAAMRQHLARLISFDGIWIGLWNAEHRQFDPLVAEGLSESQVFAQLATGFSMLSANHQPPVDRFGTDPNGVGSSPDERQTGGNMSGASASNLHVPIVLGDELIGAIYVRRDGIDRFSERELILLQEAALQAAGILKKVQSTVPVSRFNMVLHSTVSLTAKVSRLDNLFDACSRFAEDVYSIVPYSRIIIEVVSPIEELVCCVFVQGATSNFGPPIRPYRNSQAELLAREGRGILLGDHRSNRLSYPRFGWLEARMESHGWRSGISSPIMHLGQAVGALHIRHREQQVYSEQDRVTIESAAAVLGPVIVRTQEGSSGSPFSTRTGQLTNGSEQSAGALTLGPGSMRLSVVDRDRRSREDIYARLRSLGYDVVSASETPDGLALDNVEDAETVVVYVAEGPDGDSFDTINREVRRLIAEGHAVVVLADGQDDRMLSERIDRDVGGILLKSASDAALNVGISQAVRGGRVIDPQMVGMFFSSLHTAPIKTQSQEEVAPDTLNDKELAIMRLLIAGETNQEIGVRLNLASGTVKNKVSRIYQKLGVTRRAEAISAMLGQLPYLQPGMKNGHN